MVEKKSERFSAVLQALDVGDESTSLDGEEKSLRCPFVPALKNLFLRKAIEGNVQLHRIKMLSIEFEPLSLGKIRGEEDTIPPMGIIVATCSNKDHS